jgi:nitrogen fixation NifU-like protein
MCSPSILYSSAVLDHFKTPRNAGVLENPTAQVEVTNPACADVMQLGITVLDGRIVAAKFKTVGCVTAIACGSILTEMISGRTVAEAKRLTYQEIAAALGGLPPAAMHGSQLAADALGAVLAKLLTGP